MYSLEQLQKVIDCPKLALQEFNRLYYRKFYTEDYNTEGFKVMDEDWDNLIILDACRYDLFEEYADSFRGHLQKRLSRGSGTIEFLNGNFDNKKYRDTVYVTANPQLYRNGFQDRFHSVINIWAEDGWDETLGTVLPDNVVDYSKKAYQEHKNKRLIIHFIQPHYPFLTQDTEFDKGHIDQAGVGEGDLWQQIFKSKLSVPESKLWSLYRSNLEETLPHVKEIIRSVPGKTVITSDHGNMIGERARPIPIREWGHPLGVYTKELVEVPWFVADFEERRTILSTGRDQTSVDSIKEGMVEDRLKDLGYLN